MSVSGPVGFKTTISAHVAKTLKVAMVADILGVSTSENHINMKFVLFKSKQHKYFHQKRPVHAKRMRNFPLMFDVTFAVAIAQCEQDLIVNFQDDRFPKGTGIEGANVQSVICVPVVFPTGDLICKFLFKL